MNRTGQPTRVPTLAPNPGLGGTFRGPFPPYGMAPRNVMPGYPAIPNSHRAMPPQPSPNFLQQRGQNNFPFGGGLQQAQQTQTPAQHTTPTPLTHTPHPQQQQQTTVTSTHPPHLAQTPAPSLGTAPSVSSASEVGLDPNDFPALGSTPANNASPAANTAVTSYATQAGTAAGGSGVQSGSTVTGGNQPRDFTSDDFPALGGQTHLADSHPPGLNGFQQHGDQQHRQTLLGSLTGGVQQPGLLNLGQARGQLGLHVDTDKRSLALKQNQNHQSAAAAWNSPNVNSNAQPSGFPNALSNGAIQSHTQTQQQHLNAPPGVPPPATFTQQQIQPTQPTQPTPYAANGTVAGETSQGPAHATAAIPQSAAQQILMSPADRWGLLGLLALIKNAGVDEHLLSVGTDLGTMGLDMQTPGNLFSTFITPWADSSAAHTVEPDFHLPACYNVQPPPPNVQKASSFSDETLFFMFYSSPRDALQDVAAQELWTRNWRFHKELRVWLTKEMGTSPVHNVPGGEQGQYSYWDPENWERGRKQMTVFYKDLEDKSPFPPLQPQQAAPQVGRVNANAFQPMGMAAM